LDVPSRHEEDGEQNDQYVNSIGTERLSMDSLEETGGEDDRGSIAYEL
jgi:hypothetical protein